MRIEATHVQFRPCFDLTYFSLVAFARWLSSAWSSRLSSPRSAEE